MVTAKRLAAGEHEPSRAKMRRARTAAAVMAGRAAGAGARRLHLGAGTSLPGLVASRLDPAITARLSAELRHGSAVITGTNGKTTTSGLLAYILRDAGLRVWRNREGANLLRGVTAALVIRALPSGHLRREGNAAAVFEVDEAAFPAVLANLRPRTVVVTNLFRDQLDRYGEVDTVAERWRGALAAAGDETALALNADDPAIAALADGAHGPVRYFGVESLAPGEGAIPEHDTDVLDTRTCSRCGSALEYRLRLYSHVGHWRCTGCDFVRPTPTVSARAVAPDGIDAMRFELVTPDGTAAVRLGLPGLYNVYNALAAAAAGHLMGASLARTVSAIERFTPAFGRAERIQVDGREVRIMLAKNPTGLNEVLRALAASGAARHHLFLLLNDRPADGEDVSWIWDADFERVPRIACSIVVSGTRAADLAVRLKYAGVPLSRLPARQEGAVSSSGGSVPVATSVAQPDAEGNTLATVVESNVPHALDAALAQVGPGESLVIVPTYTAMLAVRAELERRGYTPHYWETADA